MNRNDKINKIIKLKLDIKTIELEMERMKQNIRDLEEELKILNTSEVPLLLFILDETIPNPDDKRDYRFEYIYYYPDLKRIDIIKRNDAYSFLDKTIDIRHFFRFMGIPNNIWPSSSALLYQKKIDFAREIIEQIIGQIFNENKIESWNDVISFIPLYLDFYEVPKYDQSMENSIKKALIPRK